MDTYQFEKYDTTCGVAVYCLFIFCSHHKWALHTPYCYCNFFSTLSSPPRNFDDRMILVWLFIHQLNLLRHCPLSLSRARSFAYRISLAELNINTDRGEIYSANQHDVNSIHTQHLTDELVWLWFFWLVYLDGLSCVAELLLATGSIWIDVKCSTYSAIWFLNKCVRDKDAKCKTVWLRKN